MEMQVRQAPIHVTIAEITDTEVVDGIQQLLMPHLMPSLDSQAKLPVAPLDHVLSPGLPLSCSNPQVSLMSCDDLPTSSVGTQHFRSLRRKRPLGQSAADGLLQRHCLGGAAPCGPSNIS